jgi:hypothetical protein
VAGALPVLLRWTSIAPQHHCTAGANTAAPTSWPPFLCGNLPPATSHQPRPATTRRYGYERQLLKILQRLVSDMDRKIEKQQERATLESQPKVPAPAQQAELDGIKQKIKGGPGTHFSWLNVCMVGGCWHARPWTWRARRGRTGGRDLSAALHACKMPDWRPPCLCL